MSIIRRIRRIVRARRAPEPADPATQLQDTQQRQAASLESARRSVADMAADCRRIELLIDESVAERDNSDREAEACVARGDDDGARAALRRSVAASKRADDLTQRHQRMAEQWRRLDDELTRMTSRADENRMRNEALQARHHAATAALQAHRAAGDDSAATMAQAAQQAERRTRRLEAEAEARDELAWSDPDSARVDEAFEWLQAKSEVDGRLDAIRSKQQGDTEQNRD